MAKTGIMGELERTLIDQIEKLNDDSILSDADSARILIDRSKAITDLSTAYIGVQNLKLNLMREVNRNGIPPEMQGILGIEDGRGK